MNGQLQGFHHLAMRVRDFDGSVAFYTKGLGLEQTMAWGEGDGRAVMLACGNGNHIELFAGGAPMPEGVVLHFAFTTEDCDGAFARAVAAGAVEHMAPKSLTIPSQPAPLPVRIAFVKGPDGEVIEFFQRA